jgi:hypothetical protein
MVATVYATLTGDTRLLPFALLWTVGFAFGTWYCWNIDPHYNSRPRRR